MIGIEFSPEYQYWQNRQLQVAEYGISNAPSRRGFRNCPTLGGTARFFLIYFIGVRQTDRIYFCVFRTTPWVISYSHRVNCFQPSRLARLAARLATLIGESIT